MLALSKPQEIFLNGLNTKYRAFVGGFGSGKTFIGCLDLITFAGQHPKTRQGYFAPTYPDIKDIFYPTIEEAAHLMGFTVDIKTGNKEVELYRNGNWYGTIICRSMNDPKTIVGFKVARALVDEIDTLPKDKAELAWNKIVARLRLVIPGVQNGIGVTTTPEGFMFVYDKWANNPTISYSMVQASSYENMKYLPDDYIDSLLETYPPELVDAYVRGKFINLRSGTVYNSYNRVTCRSRETIQEKEPLRIGMDFNVQAMAAVIFVMRGKEWHAVAELTDIYDTPAMIQAIQEKWPEHAIRIYPDASGKSRKTVDASISDIALLEQAGFSIYVESKNPFVKDRVLATNTAFSKGLLFVNDAECTDIAKGLEQQAYDKNGSPDKTSGMDHGNDAFSYPIANELPIVKPPTRLKISFAR